MQTILVTGETGFGKSTLLSALAARHNMTVIDPFVEAAQVWHEPDPETCGGVVVDHVGSLEDAKAIVSVAAAWCEFHGVNLWLCDIWRSYLNDAGIVAPDDTIELCIERDMWPWPVTVEPGKRITCPLDQAAMIADRIVA
jgi:hypothetical protein